MKHQAKAILAIASLLISCFVVAQNGVGKRNSLNLTTRVEKYDFSKGVLYWIRDNKETRYAKTNKYLLCGMHFPDGGVSDFR